VNTQWELHPAVFQEIWLKWDCPHVDLSDTSEFQIPTYVSPIPDNKVLVVDAMSLSWKGIFSCMSLPPFSFFPGFYTKSVFNLAKPSSIMAKTVIIARSSALLYKTNLSNFLSG
jgi:hypothetical protein